MAAFASVIIDSFSLIGLLQKMVQEGGTPGDKKNKSHDLQKKRTALEHELELRSGLSALYALLF